MKPASYNDRSEAGTSLVEVLLALAILGIAVASIVSGLGTASLASDYHRKQVNGDTVVRSYAEAIKQRATVGAYIRCSVPSHYNYQSAGPIFPANFWAPADPTMYRAEVTSIRYWRAGSGFTDTCGTDEGAQLLDLRAYSVDNRDSQTLQVIVRAP